MTERKEFTMSDEDFDAIMDASKPVPYLIIGGREPRSPQENANDAWRRLGQKMGFDFMTVQPVPDKGTHTFTAEVTA